LSEPVVFEADSAGPARRRNHGNEPPCPVVWTILGRRPPLRPAGR
jgi:hypothetical protein